MAFCIGSAWAAFKDLDLDTGMAVSLSSILIPRTRPQTVKPLTSNLLVLHVDSFPTASLLLKDICLAALFQVFLPFFCWPYCVLLEFKASGEPQ